MGNSQLKWKSVATNRTVCWWETGRSKATVTSVFCQMAVAIGVVVPYSRCRGWVIWQADITAWVPKNHWCCFGVCWPFKWQKGNCLQFVHLVWSILNQLPLSHVPEQTWPDATGITSSSFTSWQVVTSPLPSATLYNQTYQNTNVVSKKQNLLTKYRTKTISKCTIYQPKTNPTSSKAPPLPRLWGRVDGFFFQQEPWWFHRPPRNRCPVENHLVSSCESDTRSLTTICSYNKANVLDSRIHMDMIHTWTFMYIYIYLYIHIHSFYLCICVNTFTYRCINDSVICFLDENVFSFISHGNHEFISCW